MDTFEIKYESEFERKVFAAMINGLRARYANAVLVARAKNLAYPSYDVWLEHLLIEEKQRHVKELQTLWKQLGE